MTVLLTGADGFIGSHLSYSLFKKGIIIYALDVKRSTSSVFRKSYIWDELYAIPINEIDFIVHLAGKAHDLRNTTNEEEYFNINFGLTKVLINWLNRYENKESSKKPVFIMMSSVKACRDSIPFKMTEETTAKPLTAYGKSKLQAEQYVCNNYKDYYVLRSCMIHGPGNKGNLNLLFSYAKLGIPWPLGAYKNKRSFMGIGNLCYIIEKLIITNPGTGLYLVADDETLSTNEILQLIWHRWGKKTFILKIPKWFIENIAILGSILHLPLTKDRLIKLTDSFEVSNNEIKKLLGIEKLPYSTIESFNITIDSVIENAKIYNN